MAVADLYRNQAIAFPGIEGEGLGLLGRLPEAAVQTLADKVDPARVVRTGPTWGRPNCFNPQTGACPGNT